jgi:flagellar basal-body rod modification protein FlgD
VTSGTSIESKGDGKDMELPFYLDKPAKAVAIHIYDNKNQMIGRIDKEDIGKGMQAITWDGIGVDGQLAPKETYHFDVVAYDDQNQKFMGQTRSEGVVTGVNFENGDTIFTLNDGKKVFLRDVDSFAVDKNEMSGKNIPALQKQASNAYNQVVEPKN